MTCVSGLAVEHGDQAGISGRGSRAVLGNAESGGTQSAAGTKSGVRSFLSFFNLSGPRASNEEARKNTTVPTAVEARNDPSGMPASRTEKKRDGGQQRASSNFETTKKDAGTTNERRSQERSTEKQNDPAVGQAVDSAAFAMANAASPFAEASVPLDSLPKQSPLGQACTSQIGRAVEVQESSFARHGGTSSSAGESKEVRATLHAEFVTATPPFDGESSDHAVGTGDQGHEKRSAAEMHSAGFLASESQRARAASSLGGRDAQADEIGATSRTQELSPNPLRAQHGPHVEASPDVAQNEKNSSAQALRRQAPSSEALRNAVPEPNRRADGSKEKAQPATPSAMAVKSDVSRGSTSIQATQHTAGSSVDDARAATLGSGLNSRAANPEGSVLVPQEPVHGASGSAPHGETRSIAASPTSTQETFTALETGSSPRPTWAHATTSKAEAGYEDPTLGWVGVRAHVDGSGLHAALVPVSEAAGHTLSGHLAGLGTYLAEQRARVETLTIAPPESGSETQSALPSGGDGERHTNQQNAQTPTDSRSAEGRSEDDAHETLTRRIAPAAEPSLFAREGTHISVMA